jgi:hypothetical protein
MAANVSMLLLRQLSRRVGAFRNLETFSTRHLYQVNTPLILGLQCKTMVSVIVIVHYSINPIIYFTKILHSFILILIA